MPRESHSRGFGPASLLDVALILLVSAIAMLAPRKAEALPSFARQTGLGCGSCHTEFPQLTPFGRRFKIGGYTLGDTAHAKRTLVDSPYTRKAEGTPDWELPLSVQAIASFTHTGADQDTAGSAPFIKANNNVEFQTASLFYGGAVTDHIGVFAQATYTAQGFGPPAARVSPAFRAPDRNPGLVQPGRSPSLAAALPLATPGLADGQGCSAALR